MLLVEVYYTCKPGTRDQVLEFAKVNVAATRQESGNLSYTQYPSPDNDQDMFVFEKWESVEHFMSHSKTEHNKTFSALRRPHLEPGSYQITIYNAEENVELTEAVRAAVKASAEK